MKNYDKIIHQIGPFGRYQKLLVALYGVPMSLYSAWVYYALVFANIEPKFACNATTIDWDNKCGKNKSGFCDSGYSYDLDHNQIGNTIPSEWDLVCDQSVRVSLTFTASQAGELLGLFMVTYIMDNLGRRVCVTLSNLWFLGTGIIMFFAPSIVFLQVIAFFRGFTIRMAFQLPWIVCQEFVSSEYCSKVYLLMAVGWAVGLGSLSLISWPIQDWRYIILTVTVPALAVVPYWFLVYESPRWLVAKGKLEEAQKILNRVAKINGVKVQPDELSSMLHSQDGEQNHERQKTTFLTLFTHGFNLTAKVLILCALNVFVYLVYTGLNYNMDNFQANPYIVTALSALVEIPAALGSPLADRYGRVFLSALALFSAGLFALIGVVVPIGTPAVPVVTAVATKLSITLAFNYIIILISETYPTVVRATGIGLCCLTSLVCGFAVPYIIYAARATGLIILPMIVFSAMAFLGSFLVLLLPETMGKPLVDTIEEEKLRKVTFGNVKSNLRICGRRREDRETQDKSGVEL